jgi:hypothetical protein
MYLLSINFYELGQFLQIILWISLPMVIIVLLVTTYLHYRKKRKREKEKEYVDIAGGPVEISLENTGNAYRGLLWMKDKYEEYRDQTDNKLERLKGELARSEQKYLGLLAERDDQKGSLQPAPPRPTILPQKTPADMQQNSPPDDSLSTGPAAQQNLSDELSLSPAGLLEKATLPPGSTSEDSARENPREVADLRDLVADKDRQIGFLHVELDQRIKNYHELDYQHQEEKTRAEELAGQYLQAQQKLEAQQLKIDELNERLGHEMSKAGDLTGKLENNMRLLLHIHQELDKSLHVQQPDNSLPVLPSPQQSHEPRQDQSLSLTENTKIVGWIESEETGINKP